MSGRLSVGHSLNAGIVKTSGCGMDTKTVSVILYVRDFELVIHLQQILSTLTSQIAWESNSP